MDPQARSTHDSSSIRNQEHFHLDQATSYYAPHLAAEKTKVQDELLIAEPNKGIECFQTSGRRVTARFKTKKVIVEYKPCDGGSFLVDLEARNSTFDAIRNLAASLSFVDPTVIGLLECTDYLHSDDLSNPRFGLVYKVPFIVPDDKPQTLKNLLEAKDNKGRRCTAMDPLDARITLARRLAYALCFLHSVGWVHKAIRSNDILVLEPSNPSHD